MRYSLPDSSNNVVHLIKRWAVLLGSLSALFLSSGCRASSNQNIAVGSDKVIRSAYASLEELFQTEIINIGLEKLGHTPVSGSELEYDVIHQAIARDYLDYTAVHWYPIHKDFFEQNGGNTSFKRLEPVVESALQGYLIDKKTSAERNITGLPDLQDPAIAQLFDTDGNGKANLVGCPRGWACREVIESHLDDHNLRDTVEQDSHDYNASMEKIIERYDAGEPVLYFTWTPLWVSSALVPDQDVVWLDVPPLGPQENASIVDGKNLGFEINDIHILANREFLKENPDIARWFELVNIPIMDVSLQNQRMRNGENNPEDIRRHAEEWIRENQGAFDGWLEDAQQVSER
ncbi:glycine betaine/L-proline ABC transporter substrate-binding protein ProX [Leptolyngbya cf. ectocarpi LEGE 11479]|uniref:Glycine betaine/L-proline ABC transporter substrate-binding protein ProX n=1 Tax=Leptolyngbya cf. ectocarpi LEGE 11479 TaxID=1828722 RepID=A0A928ZVJ2_LEPEC|nr:glycine betaine/L-proline ABC transporter substrate-binding protein ProX [Leptolyngbya ectocarpi]MBE9068262.1 glycine betaine/L-proline ABC transporter substrate-binding protein ProX [Leptolyngbya cf. ectocarpi LEGE 11479]